MVPRFQRRQLVAPVGATELLEWGIIVGPAVAVEVQEFVFLGELLEQSPGREWALGWANTEPPTFPLYAGTETATMGVRSGVRLHYSLPFLVDQADVPFPLATSTHQLNVYATVTYPPASWRQVFSVNGDGGTTEFFGVTDAVPPGAVAVLVQVVAFNFGSPNAGQQSGAVSFRDHNAA